MFGGSERAVDTPKLISSSHGAPFVSLLSSFPSTPDFPLLHPSLPPNRSRITHVKLRIRNRTRSVPKKCFKKTQNQVVMRSSDSNPQDLQLRLSLGDQPLKPCRRDILLRVAFAALYFPALVPPSSAEEELPEGFRVYSDEVNRFKVMIPQDWLVGEGEGNGIKSVTAFYPEEASNSNVSIVITGLGADFTRLESFGKVGAFAENLVGGLDRSWQRPPGVAAKLLDSKAANGLYYIEYSLQNPGESRRHLFSVLGIANNGWYNRLYTLTGQFMEYEVEKYGSEVEKAVASFRLL